MTGIAVRRIAASSAARSVTHHDDVRVALCAPGEIWGGVEEFVDSFSVHLQGRGVPVRVILFHDGRLSEKLARRGVPVFVAAGRGKYDPALVTHVAGYLRAHRINVLHTHGYKASVIGAIAGLLTGTPVVRTEHGRTEPWRGVARAKMSVNSALERILTRRAVNAVAYVSKDVRAGSKTAGSGRLERVIYNGIDARHHAGPCVDRLEAARDTFKVGIVGRIAPVKGHEFLLRAMGALRHRDIRLYVFGTGPLEAALREQCAAADLETVSFLGFRDNIPGYLKQLDLLAVPSLHEGLPYTLLEALAAGVPIVASRVGGLAEVLEDRRTALLVPPGDAAQLAQAIDYAADHPAVLADLAARGRELLEQKFLVATMADHYLDLYRDVLRS